MPHSTGFPYSGPLLDDDDDVDVATLSNDFCRCNTFVELATLPTGPFGGLCTAARALAATKETEVGGSVPIFKGEKVEQDVSCFC